MAYNPNNPNGQATAADSAPVVLASDQFPLAAAITDGSANFTVTTVESAGMIYNGVTWDRLKSMEGLSGTTDNTTVTGVQAVGVGPGFNIRHNPANLGTAANSTSQFNTDGSSGVLLTVGTTTTGTFTVEATGDGTNWGSPEVFDATNDQWVSAQNITPTLGNNYQILSSNYRAVRLRTVTTLGATMAHTFTGSLALPLLSGIDTGAAPHNFGYTLWHRDVSTGVTITSTAIFTPATGKRFAVTDLTVMAGGTTAGVVTIYDATAGTAFSQGTTNAIFRGEFAPSTTSRPGFSKTFTVPYVSSAVNNSVILTTSAAINTLYIQINGYSI